jgi:hypothetical protein
MSRRIARKHEDVRRVSAAKLVLRTLKNRSSNKKGHTIQESRKIAF